jgi:DNA repair exonuclease SbcCD nuclease subunit
MKILLITDQHFGVRNDNQVFIDKYREFYTKTVIPYIKRNKIKTVICLGDTFDKRKSINFLSLDAAKQMWFKPLAELGVNLYMILGNHDIYYKNTVKVNAPSHLLGEFDNITVIDQPTHTKFDKTDFLLLPWMCEENKKECMNVVADSKAKVCLGHLELTGFEAVPGVRMEHGMDPEPFEKFDLTCSGHFHMKSRQGNIQYLGNPYQLYWNDFGHTRGFHILNTDTLTLSFHKNPYTIFNKLWYDDVKDNYEELPDFKNMKGSYVKVVVQNRENQVWFDRYIKALNDADVADLKIIEDVTVELEDVDDSIKMEDTMTILETYVEGLEEAIDKKNVTSILKSLYVEALDL